MEMWLRIPELLGLLALPSHRVGARAIEQMLLAKVLAIAKLERFSSCAAGFSVHGGLVQRRQGGDSLTS